MINDEWIKLFLKRVTSRNRNAFFFQFTDNKVFIHNLQLIFLTNKLLRFVPAKNTKCLFSAGY